MTLHLGSLRAASIVGSSGLSSNETPGSLELQGVLEAAGA